jgi:hypothetical protein
VISSRHQRIRCLVQSLFLSIIPAILNRLFVFLWSHSYVHYFSTRWHPRSRYVLSLLLLPCHCFMTRGWSKSISVSDLQLVCCSAWTRGVLKNGNPSHPPLFSAGICLWLNTARCIQALGRITVEWSVAGPCATLLATNATKLSHTISSLPN